MNEPMLSQQTACRNFWNLYAMSYKDKDLLNCLSQFLINGHQNLLEDDIVKVFKAFAHFDYLNLEARDALLKTTIRNSQNYSFASLAEICQSLTRLGFENQTLLKIIKNSIVSVRQRGEVE